MSRSLQWSKVAACLVAVAAFASCNNAASVAQTTECSIPFGIGPDGTCNLGEMCLPNSVGQCSGNDCCHGFCAYYNCTGDCLTITPDQIPDGGAPGCACDDAGDPCVCGDAGAPCYRSSCLEVCGTPG